MGRNVVRTDLAAAAHALVSGGRGLLSLDTAAHAYRELPITAPGIERYVGGMVLDDATIRRSARGGRRIVEVLRDRGILPGVAVGLGDGLSTLPWRLAEYAALGAGFATCRAAFRIESGVGPPADRTIASNAHALARFAALCQTSGIVPIVACDVLAEGDHTIARCEDATTRVLRRTFAALADADVVLDAMVLAVNMVTPGLASSQRAEAGDVVAATLRVLGATVPVAVAGVAFLGGEHDDRIATERLCALNKTMPRRRPWPLTFEYGRATEHTAQSLLHRLRCSGLAACGAYTAKTEDLDLTATRVPGIAA
ncbi:MAG TPA: class I fructose-bisphosphate aldolase [Candidatus Elarobacter sp.]|nr:class I fructose-bisphosphate aldolase [Candidatus Elarobacter sp.]HEV2737398.1 class I fructose-bisphosphate aldolase [Candidatus Elarobacter sp.]